MRYLQRTLERKKIFNKKAELPKTEKEFMDWFADLADRIDSERLAADGERPRCEQEAIYHAVMAEWTELESLFGRQVSVDEAEDHLYNNL